MPLIRSYILLFSESGFRAIDFIIKRTSVETRKPQANMESHPIMMKNWNYSLNLYIYFTINGTNYFAVAVTRGANFQIAYFLYTSLALFWFGLRLPLQSTSCCLPLFIFCSLSVLSYWISENLLNFSWWNPFPLHFTSPKQDGVSSVRGIKLIE